MNYKIEGGTLPVVTVSLDAGESIYTQSGGMSWMTGDIDMDTNMRGGLLKGLGRMFSGESLFMATYTARRPNQEIALASAFPGSILPLQIGQTEWICQKNSFLCAEQSVELSAYVVKGMSGGFFGGEGFVLQRLHGNGMAFVEIDGFAIEKNLAPGEILKVDTGNVALFESSVRYSVETVKGFKNIFFGGEGLFLTTLEGPGKVYLQTISVSSFVSHIAGYLPDHSD